MKTNLLFVVLFLLSTLSHAQNDIIITSQGQEVNLYDNITVYSHPEFKSLHRDSIVDAYESRRFLKPENQRIYIYPKGENVILHFKVKNNSRAQLPIFLTMANPYLHYGKVHYRSKKGITSLNEVNYYEKHPFKTVYYRHPAWKINIEVNEVVDVFLEVLDSETRTRLDLKLETEFNFFKRVEKEYLSMGFYLAFLFVLLIGLSVFGVLQKEYSVFFYAFYIVFLIIEYFAAKGIGVQLIWSDYLFITNNVRSMSQCLALMTSSAFFMHFYEYDRKTLWVKQFFKGVLVLMVGVLSIYMIKFIFGGLMALYVYVWVLLKTLIVIFVLLHLFLAYKKRLPYYLSIAFSLPIVGLLIQMFNNPSVDNSTSLIWLISNGFYIGITIEILLVTYFILSSVIKSQIYYNELKKETKWLIMDYQDKLIKTEVNAKNTIAYDIHDSFGNSLTALKLNILNLKNNNKRINDPEIVKIESILNSLNEEYSYLLNASLSPDINSMNLEGHIRELVDRQNELTNINIQRDIKIYGKHLSETKCLNIYRIVSELLTNSIKHSKSENIWLSIKQNEFSIFLEVTDDGIGFNPKKIEANSFGLKSIEKRVDLFSGKLEIDPNREIGANIKIEIPI